MTPTERVEPGLPVAERPPLGDGVPSPGPGGEGRRPSVVAGLLHSARPKQWVKNLLVAAAPGAAGVLGHGDVIPNVALGILAFCLVASGTYLLNDARDAEADRRHPLKRSRPIAAEVVPVRLGVCVGIALLMAGFGAALAVDLDFAALVALYVALTTAYTLVLRQVVVVDLAIVASGFIVRAVAGGAAADVPISRWFLIVASFGSLFIVAGKRHGEHLDLGPERSATRPTLGLYSREYLRYIWTVASAVTLTAYCLWAFEQQHEGQAIPWSELSIVPFTLFVLRYAFLLEAGKGSAPEDTVLGDPMLRAMAVTWLVVFALGVHVGR